ncbi:MAG: PQQ-binding-like beta-propeller repeat protein [Phycisphaerae bacterium]
MSPHSRVRGVLILCAAVLAAAVACHAQERADDPVKQKALDIQTASGYRAGLVVHLNCGDGRLTAALGPDDAFLVQGLESDAGKVADAREFIGKLGRYGRITVQQWSGASLPYVDNLVNVLAAEDLGKVPMDEVMRVLSPGGVACILKDGKWTRTVKPRPKEIDEWTHDLHDASNNAVAHDTIVGPPRRLQWIGSPAWSRHHDQMSSMNAMVSSGGRVFYVFDEGPYDSILLPSRWMLIARDAFSGVVLWKRAIANWHPTLYPFKSGPAYLPRRLVAVGDKVFVTLALDAPLTCLDAASGGTLRTLEGSKSTEEVIVSDGVVFLTANDSPADWSRYKMETHDVRDEKNTVAEKWPWDKKARRIMAFKADGGELLWKKEYPVSPMTLAADKNGVYFHDGDRIVCLKRDSGEEAWKSEPVKSRAAIPTGYGSTLVVYDGVLLFSGLTKTMTALDAATGKKLWEEEHPPSGHNSPEDVLVAGGLVWAGDIADPKDAGVFKGRDLRTGEVKREFPPDVKTYWFHHRCYRSKATDKYLLPSRTGVEFVDIEARKWTTNHWVRGSCIYGVMPANGLLYAPQHPCACYLESKLNGLCALAPEAKTPAGATTQPSDEARLERGPAFDRKVDSGKAVAEADWPTYRHDAARSGFTKTAVPADVQQAWQADIGGRLTSPVVADGKIVVASIDTHTVFALAADDGRKLWTFTAGGRVDSPPTIHLGRVLFGSADGWVYCLDAIDGAMIWRFRGAPEERQMVSFEQVESVWPVHGSVLVQGDAVCFVAGRSMFVDGGLRLVRLDAKTGKKLTETIMDDRDPATGLNLQSKVAMLNMPVALPDILSCDGRWIYMRSQRFDLEGKRPSVDQIPASQQAGEGRHLFSPTGFLDDNWFHRSYWIYGRSFNSGPQQWYRLGHQTPAGGIMAVDQSRAYSYGRLPQYYRWTTPVQYQLYAADKDAKGVRATTEAAMAYKPGDSLNDNNSSSIVPAIWSLDVPVLVRAMALADKTLFVAGPPRVVDEEEAFSRQNDPAMKAKLVEQATALKGSQGGILLAVSAADGKRLAEIKLDATPVFDGMIAASGRLFIATKAGKVLCLGDK